MQAASWASRWMIRLLADWGPGWASWAGWAAGLEVSLAEQMHSFLVRECTTQKKWSRGCHSSGLSVGLRYAATSEGTIGS